MPTEMADITLSEDKTKFLEIVRAHCRAQNVHKTPQGADRMSGRFHDQRIIGVTSARDHEAEEEYASDDEAAAFIHWNEAEDRFLHDYAIIEALREVKGKQVRRIHRVRISDLKATNVETLNRVYEPVTSKQVLQKFRGDPRELYSLPIRSNYTYEWVKFEGYLGRVIMEDVGITGHYALDVASKREATRRREEVQAAYKAEQRKKGKGKMKAKARRSS